MSRRRQQVLDAALTVVGAEGARGLTYQAVDQEAGVPAGTTSNCFRNRAALLHGVLAHLVEEDRRAWERFTSRAPGGIDELAETLAELARHSIGPGRTRTRARYALFLEAGTRPELAELLTGGRAAVLDWGADWLAGLDLPAPRERYRRLIAQLDGIVLHQLTFPGEPFDPEPGFRAILTDETT
ncbi:TetR/AcrR family transcriptional regulator [Amycolatopsis nigrescens]|uniref:TetR/AcrR family transcriptional regulator n=1 Tax=Amycolatopsis nigrescens TaxID=381445 RepID=UPI00047564EE|nr:TetR family transcriptional regulator [Amycolatopsis nigrescens]